MSQAVLFLALHLCGVAVALAAIRSPKVACAVGFPLGVCLGVVASLLVLILGLPYTAATLGAALAGTAVIGVAVAGRRGRLDRRALRLAGLWSLGFVAVAAAASAINLSIMSYDSHALVLFGQVIGQDAALSEGLVFRLSHWGVFLPIAQSWAAFLPVEYLWALAPVLGLSLVPLFVLSLDALIAPLELAPATRRRLLALVTAASFTVFFFHHHFIYIHNNIPSAVYLTGFVGLMVIAETRRDAGAAIIAFVLLCGCAVMRVEAPLATLLFAVIFAFPSRLGRATIGVGLGLYAALVSVWYLRLAASAPSSGDFLTAGRCFMVVALVTGTWILWWLSSHPRLARLVRFTPEIAAATVGLGLVLAFALEPAHMGISARSWAINLVVSDYWGLAWPLLAAVLILAAWLPPFPPARALGFGLAAAVGLIILLAFGRTPYRAIHVGDSANRMMLHLLPLLFLFIGARLGAGLALRDQQPT